MTNLMSQIRVRTYWKKKNNVKVNCKVATVGCKNR